MKNYVLASSLLVVISLLGFDFALFPKIADLVGDISLTNPGLIETLRTKMIYFSVGYIIAICLINLFIYNKFKSLDDEKQKMENMLKINSQEQSVLSKIDSVKNKIKFYEGLMKNVILIEVGWVVGGMLYLIVSPILEISWSPLN